VKDVHPISRTKSLKEKAYDVLKGLILTGRLEQGKLHNEKRIAEVLGVSRTPVREALLELSREGMVKFLPGKGVEVRKITAKQIQEVFEIRKIIEGHVIRAIVVRLTPSDFSRIKKLMTTQRKMAKCCDTVQFIEADKDFHLYLSSKTDNKRLENILQNLRDQMHLMGLRAVENPSRLQQVIEEHYSIISALEQKDGRKAYRELMRHLTNTEKILVSLIEKEQIVKRLPI
jgi:DNA-binding GntR family transcriptional regulator